MASIGKLVATIAEVSGQDMATIKLVARYAREAGCISQASRGPGAARMTAQDAASLLIALAGADLAKHTPFVITNVGSLRSSTPQKAKGLPAILKKTWEIGTPFRDALATLIERVQKEEFHELLAAGEVHIEVEIERSRPEAAIRITRRGRPVFECYFIVPGLLIDYRPTPPDAWAFKITFRNGTLLAVADTLQK